MASSAVAAIDNVGPTTSAATFLSVTLSLDKQKITTPLPSRAPRPKMLVPRNCQKKTCRVMVEGYSDSKYVYGQLEIHKGKEAKGFLYLPSMQVYVYGKVVGTHSILVKDTKGNLYRLVPVKNNQPYNNKYPMRKSKDFRY